MNQNVISSLGIVALLGGILFPMLLVLVSGLLIGSGGVFDGFVGQAVFMTFVCFLAGVFGLYLAQQDALGLAGTVATAVFATGLVLTVIDAMLTMIGISIPSGAQFSDASFALLALGAIALGIVTARANVLAHARLGGVMLAVAFPVTFIGLIVLGILGIESMVAAAFFIAVPFGAAWIILGLDMATIDETTEFTAESTSSTHS